MAGDGCPKFVLPLKFDKELFKTPELPFNDEGVLLPVGGFGVFAPLLGFGEAEAEFDK